VAKDATVAATVAEVANANTTKSNGALPKTLGSTHQGHETHETHETHGLHIGAYKFRLMTGYTKLVVPAAVASQ
jgi:hypothetical protein